MEIADFRWLACHVGLCCVLASGQLTAGPHLSERYVKAWILTNSKATRVQGIAELKSIIENEPHDWRVYHSLVEASRHDPLLSNAVDNYFRDTVQTKPHAALPHFGLAYLAGLQGRTTKSMHEARTCASRDPTAAACFTLWAQQAGVHLGQKTPLTKAGRLFPAFETSPYACIARTNFAAMAREMTTHNKVRQECFKISESHPDERLRYYINVEHYLMAGGMVIQGSDFDNNRNAAIEWAQRESDDQALIGLLSIGASQQLSSDNWKDARTAIDRLLTKSEGFGPRAQIDSRYYLARLFGATGDLEQSVVQWEIHRTLYVDAGVPIGNALMHLGHAYRRVGRTTEAIAALNEAVALGRRERNYVALAFYLRVLAIFQQETGDYWNALDNAHESIRLFRRAKMSYQAGAGEGNLPDIYLSIGLDSKALKHAVAALQSARLHGDRSEVKRNQAVVGGILSRMGRASQALANFEDALKIKEDAQGAFQSEALLGKADALRRLSRSQEALELLDRVLKDAQLKGAQSRIAATLYTMGLTEIRDHRISPAEAHFAASLATAEQHELKELVVANLKNLAEIHRLNGRPLERWQALDRAINLIGALRSRIPTPELREEFQGLNAQVFDDAVDALRLLHRSDASKGWDRKAFAVAEQARSRVLMDLMTESRFQVERGLSADQKREKDRLEQQVSIALATQMGESSEKNLAKVRAAEQALTDWVERMRSRNPDYVSVRYPEPATVEVAQKVAQRDGLSILMYSIGKNSSCGWVITPTRFQMFDVPFSGTLESKIARLREHIGRPAAPDHTLTGIARELHEQLLGTAQPLFSTEKVLIIPDGNLHYLPFESLVMRDGHFLIERHSVNYAPSVSTYAALAVGETSLDRLLAYGDPMFSKGDLASTTEDHASRVRGAFRSAGLLLSSLPSSRVEVREIAKGFPASAATIRIGRDATEASVKSEDLTQYGTIHFATHALVDERAPGRSGIVLNLVDRGIEDGVLRAGEIVNLRLRADLVVLSACQTGLGRYLRGEGMLGLTRSFLAAGAKRVVVSLWAVNDIGTADLMKLFYGNRKGSSPGDALRKAKLAMIRSPRIAYRHPYFWAGFVQQGSW